MSVDVSHAVCEFLALTHLPAESREVDNELDGVDVVGDQDEGSLLVLDEANNVVETVLGDVGLLADILLLLALRDGGSLLGETLLLLGLGLGTVLVEDLESLGGEVTVGNVLELGNRRGDLQAHVEDLLLALKADVSATRCQYLQSTVGLGIAYGHRTMRPTLRWGWMS